MNLQDVLAAVGVVINGLPQGLLALSFGFASVPTALAFIVGIIGSLAFGLVAPISFQAETITLAGTMGRNLQERISMIFWGGLGMAIIGTFGLLEGIVSFIGPTITSGMMAGVGIILTGVAVNMTKKHPLVGATSIAAGLIAYWLSNDLVYTIVSSVIISSIVGLITKQEPLVHNGETREGFKMQKIIFKNPVVIRGALAMITLNIGANIAFGKITGSLASAEVNIDKLSIYSSLADMASSLFGGAPVEAIISATGAAPHPLASGILMMALMAAILLLGLLPKIGRYVPAESIAGFLLVLGAIVTFPVNAQTALADSPVSGGVTVAVTAMTDPFTGMVAGMIVKALLGNI